MDMTSLAVAYGHAAQKRGPLGPVCISVAATPVFHRKAAPPRAGGPEQRRFIMDDVTKPGDASAGCAVR